MRHYKSGLEASADKIRIFSLGLTGCSLGLFCFLPLFYLLIYTFRVSELSFTAAPGGNQTQNRLSVFFDPVILRVTFFTFWIATLSAVICGFLGLLLGIAFEKKLRDKNGEIHSWTYAILKLLEIPFGIPVLVSAMGWILWLGNHGIIARWWQVMIGEGSILPWKLCYNFNSVLLAQCFYNVPWVTLWVIQSQLKFPLSRRWAAHSLGSTSWNTFWILEWPKLRVPLTIAVLQTFTFCTMSFALVMILGGGPPVQTLEVELYGRIRSGSLDLLGAHACAVWQLLLTLLPWSLILFFQNREAQKAFETEEMRRSVRHRPPIILLSVCSLFLLPYLPVLTKANFQLLLKAEFLQSFWGPMILSLKLASAVSFIAMNLGLLGVFSFFFVAPSSRVPILLSYIYLIPSGVSPLVMGLSLWFTYGAWFDFFSGGVISLVILHSIMFFPVAFRAWLPLLKSIRIKHLEVASTLGASLFWALLKVEWPRWRSHVGSMFAMIFVASLGEITAVSLFSSDTEPPLPLLIARWMNQYRFEEAQTLLALLLVFILVILFGTMPLRAVTSKDLNGYR